MKRDIDALIEAQAERELIAGNAVAWREAVRQDSEYRSMVDAPLPDLWYVEAARVADRLGQPAATAMLQAEIVRRSHAREGALREADRVRRGVRWHHRVKAALWALAGSSAAAVATHALMAATLAPHMLWGMGYAFAAVVAVVTIQAACGAQR